MESKLLNYFEYINKIPPLLAPFQKSSSPYILVCFANHKTSKHPQADLFLK
jgi:hypothetical protein